MKQSVYSFDKQALVEEVHKKGFSREDLQNLYSCIDLTSLGNTDTFMHIKTLCNQALQKMEVGLKPAAICVFPVFVKKVKKMLEGSGIRCASVASGFPHGQTPKEVKVKEIKMAVDYGADEIDVVINRGLFFSGELKALHDELTAMKAACGESQMKVILETGELIEEDKICLASGLALSAGANFLKTSTGKSATGATPEAAFSILDRIRECQRKDNKTVGFKAAGGIATIREAWLYYLLAQKIMGKKFTTPQFFRIGASRLAANIENQIGISII